MEQKRLILSIFPGIDLLGRAFDPPAGAFWGVIGGPPCQDFSALRRNEPTGYGREMLAEFVRVVEAAKPEWWLLENVPRVPDVRIQGYVQQRFEIDQAWYEPISRLRHIQFGSLSRALLDVPKGRKHPNAVPAALACDDRPWFAVRALQGLPKDFDLPGFTAAGKVAAVGNGVPMCLGRVLVAAVCKAYDLYGYPAGSGVQPPPIGTPAVLTRCLCGCGRILRGRQQYASACCRKRAERARREVETESHQAPPAGHVGQPG